MLFTGLKRFEDAITCFNRVLSLPTRIFHRVHMESYKKLCLLLLIAPQAHASQTQAQKSKLPFTANHVVRNFIELQKQQGEFERNSEIIVYERIEQAYQAGQSQMLEKVIGDDILKLQADRNFGLAKKVLKRLKQKQIRDLSETYLTLGFKEITEKTKTMPAKLEQVIKGMIAEGLVSARMDMRN